MVGGVGKGYNTERECKGGIEMRKELSLLGVPLDYGQTRRGVDMGPSAIRYAGAVERLRSLRYDVQDEGNIEVNAAIEACTLNGKLRHLDEVVEVNERLAHKVSEICTKGRTPIVLGGDHSVALGTLAGLSDHYERLGVIWFDAHADMNTEETTPSGNIHGMPLAASLGYGHERLVHLYKRGAKIDPDHVVIIGARSIDPGERALIRQLGVLVYTMHDIDKYGIAKVIDWTIEHFQERSVDGLHLSLDLDGLDPVDSPGVGTPVPGGLSYRESHLAMEMLAETNLLTSAEIVEVNPILDDRNKTADVAVSLMASLFGERLL